MVHVLLLSSNLIPARNLRLSSFLKPQNDSSLQCDVIFGSPSADCRGTGICKITGTNAFVPLFQKRECRATSAIATKREDSNGISLFFFRSQLCTQLYRRHFWKGILKLDEPCVIPDELRDTLHLNYQQILPGRYAVCEEDGYFRVDLDCE